MLCWFIAMHINNMRINVMRIQVMYINIFLIDVMDIIAVRDVI